MPRASERKRVSERDKPEMRYAGEAREGTHDMADEGLMAVRGDMRAAAQLEELVAL